MTRSGNDPAPRADGPGALAPDGCAVELYRLLPALGEPEIVAGALAPGASVLELGCGVGRMTRPLVDAGFRLVAVDNSPDMLRHVSGAETVLADIAALDLGRRFDAVLLASHFVNEPDAGLRARLLASCRRHVAADGVVLVERMSPAWRDTAAPGACTRIGPVERHIDELFWLGAVARATFRYVAPDGRTWRQRFATEILDDDQIAAAFASSGLALARWLDPGRRWALARPDHASRPH